MRAPYGVSLVAQLVKNPQAIQATSCSAGSMGSILGSGRPIGEGNDKPLQYSCLGNPMEWGASWATGHIQFRVWHLATKLWPPPPPLLHEHSRKERKMLNCPWHLIIFQNSCLKNILKVPLLQVFLYLIQCLKSNYLKWWTCKRQLNVFLF